MHPWLPPLLGFAPGIEVFRPARITTLHSRRAVLLPWAFTRLGLGRRISELSFATDGQPVIYDYALSSIVAPIAPLEIRREMRRNVDRE